MTKNKPYRGRGIAVGIAVLAILLLAWAGAAQSENRVWDESKGMSRNYTWNSFNFAGFYYNLDSNLTTEELTISNIDRSIARGDVSYKTSPLEVSFNYPDFGSYQVIGFMAGKYFAGYTKNSVISGKKEMSTIESGQLHRVLFDDEERRVVNVGGTLTLGEDYVLKIKEIDIGAGPGQILVALLKNGSEVDSSTVSGGGTYIYTARVGSISDLPVVAVHFDSVFRGREVNAAFVKGVFQISDSYARVSSGDRYGAMEITEASKNQIAMDNRDALDLSAGNTVDLMGNLKLIVADNSSTLRFALSAEGTGTFEVRGTVYPVAHAWTPLNFGLNIDGTSIGFYYDMDKDIGTEALDLAGPLSTNSIPKDGLVYSTAPQEVSFNYPGFGSYQVIGFMAEKYFAGYTENSAISGNRTISAIGNFQLQKVLLDDDERRVVSEGGTMTLKEGFVLKVKEVDTGAGPGQIWLTLLKDGKEVDSAVVAGGDTYRYLTRVGTVSDLPTVAVHFESVFRGREVNAAFTKGVFQLSEVNTSVKSGDRYGMMEISDVRADKIKMGNPSSIGLSPGSTLDLMGNIKVRVADSSEVRFYPFVTVTPEMVATQLVIDAPTRAAAGDTIKVNVTAGGGAVEGTQVTIDNQTGLTDLDGTAGITLPGTLKGTYNITATKLGYQRAIKSIEVAEYVSSKLSVDAPATADQFETITIRVTYNGTGIAGANVTYDNATVGSTDSNGTLSLTLEAAGTHTIYASKSGYTASAMDIMVRLPFSEFRALDINVTPAVVPTGGNIAVRSNVTNTGTKKDTLPVVLIVNSTEVDNKSVTLAPQEVKEVNFTYRVTQPAGNYTVEILGQKGSLEVVKNAPSDGVAIVIGMIICVYLLAKTKKIKF